MTNADESLLALFPLGLVLLPGEVVPLSMPLSERSTAKPEASNCAWVNPLLASHVR